MGRLEHSNCIFCQIIAGASPASFVFRDKHISAFMDIHPINRGHVLIVPNKHSEFFEEIAPSTFAKMAKLAQVLQISFNKAGIKADGSNLFLSNGLVAGQEVPHAHLHLTPRFKRDGHRMGFSGADPDQVDRSELNAIADKMKSALKSLLTEFGVLS